MPNLRGLGDLMEIPIISFEDLLSILVLIGAGYQTLTLAQYWMGRGKGGIIQDLRELDKFFICLIIGNIESLASLSIVCCWRSLPLPVGVGDLIKSIRENMLSIQVFNIPWIILIALAIAFVLRRESLGLDGLPFSKIRIKWMVTALVLLIIGYTLFIHAGYRYDDLTILSLCSIFLGSMFLLWSLRRKESIDSVVCILS